MLLRKYCGMEKTENGYLIQGNAGDIKLVFMTVTVSFGSGCPLTGNLKRLPTRLLQRHGKTNWMNCSKRSDTDQGEKCSPVRRQRMNLLFPYRNFEAGDEKAADPVPVI